MYKLSGACTTLIAIVVAFSVLGAGIDAANAQALPGIQLQQQGPYGNCSDAACGSPGAAGGNANGEWESFQKHFTKRPKGAKARICDVVAYDADQGRPPSHFAIIATLHADGTPSQTIGQNGPPAPNGETPTTAPGQTGPTGNVTLNPINTYENNPKPDTDWDVWAPTDDPPLSNDIVNAANAANNDPTATTAEGRANWLLLWTLCHERNARLMLGLNVAGPPPTSQSKSPEKPRPPSSPSSPPGQGSYNPNGSNVGGFYAGLEGGWRGTGSDVTTTQTSTFGGLDPVEDASSSLHSNNAQVGAFVGYGMPVGSNFIGQVEFGGDYGNSGSTSAGIPGTAGIPVAGIPARVPNDSTSTRQTGELHLLGRLGLPIAPSTQIFLTGGGSLLHTETTITCTIAGVCGGIGAPPFTATSSTNRPGWVLGGGIATALAGGWQARLEYRHADYGTSSATYGNPVLLSVTSGTRLTSDSVLLGLSMSFGASPPATPPIVVKAKY